MIIAIIFGKLVFLVSKILKRSGSTWPGHIALKTNSNIIKKIIQKNRHLKVVLIAGTNGKTTTNKALSYILNIQGVSTISNNAGANLLNGIASSLICDVSLSGKSKKNAAILEVDENTLPILLTQIPTPEAIIILDLFRDQLDRYGEVNATADKWKKSMEKLSDKTLVVANADDPLVCYTASFAKKVSYFTIDNINKKQQQLSHAVDSTTCPKCTSTLTYSAIAYSHLGNYKCTSCDFSTPKAKQYTFHTNLLGIYNFYNLTSAVLAADKVFGINPYTSTESLKTFKPAFGRQEIVDRDGKKIMLLLSKNPTGFNESLKVAIENKTTHLLILLNDRVPDGRDISWIWDVDFEMLKDSKIVVYVSGDRCYDMANRLLFSGITHSVFEAYEKAFERGLADTQIDKTLTILPTYSAMLEIRKHIFGKSIL